MTFTTLQSSLRSFQKNIVLIDLQYPYGKKKVYMNGSLIAIAASLMAMGHKVEVLDFNIDELSNPKVKQQIQEADLVGISVIGSPYISDAIAFARKFANKTIAVGGQVVAKLTPQQFASLFVGTRAAQVSSNADLAPLLGCDPSGIPSAFSVPLSPVWQSMGDSRLRQYLEREFALVLSQGCAYNCLFCGAEKQQLEQFVKPENFRQDLLFLAESAKTLGITMLEAYASSLDFFQNPEKVVVYLKILAEVRRQTGVDFRVRCLSCIKSFLRTYRKIDNLGKLLWEAGLWCIGFGADGTDEEVWRAQHKTHNDLDELVLCLDICQMMGIRGEMLMVMGFAQDTISSLWKNVCISVRFAGRWKDVVIRPYLAKPFIPGNSDWQTDSRVSKVIENPELFYNLDFCAFGSRLTHPRRLHRWLCNAAYLLVIVLLRPFDRCCTSPLLPQGSNGLYLKIAKLVNRLMPFDR